MSKEKNPYVGPRAFKTGETLYGRDRESRELVDMLIADRIVLLYSPSGAGKTSLIQASVIPQMTAEDYQVLPIVRPGASAEAQRPMTGGNPFVSRFIADCEKGRPEGEPHLSGMPGSALAAYLSQRAWIREDRRLKLFILDQFEEVLTSGEKEETKLAFFLQLGEALRDQSIWALFAMREEYSAALDKYRHLLPTRLSTRFRLDLLSRGEGEKAIRNPARDAGVVFTDEAAKGLIDDLSTVYERKSDGSVAERRVGFIEPLYLQIVCYRIWEKLPENTRQIAYEHIRFRAGAERGGGDSEVKMALEQYYDAKVHEVSENTAISERRIRDWLGRELVTPQGLRRQVPRGEKETAGIPNHVADALRQRFLLRVDSRSGTDWYEITHDRLADVVLSGNAGWFAKNLQSFQIKAAEWSRLDRDGDHQAAAEVALQGKELRSAKRWARQQLDDALSDVDWKFLAYSRKIRRSKRRKRFAVIVPLILVLAFAGWYFFINKELKAHSALERANKLINGASDSKWGKHNHELASLLALQAHQWMRRHNPKGGELGPWEEEILRLALQSRPFALGESHWGSAKRIVALSESRGLVVAQKDEEELLVYPLFRPAAKQRPLKLAAPLLTADFSPRDQFLVVIHKRGASLYPVGDDREAVHVRLKNGERPAGPFCLSPDGTSLMLALKSNDILIWRIDAGVAELARKLAAEKLDPPPEPPLLSALACDEQGTWIAWGNSAGDVGIIDLQAAAPDFRWLSNNSFDDWPKEVRMNFEFLKADLDYGVVALQHLPKRRWLAAVYRQGPPRIYDLDALPDRPTDAFLVPDHYSWALLSLEQERGRAVRRIANRVSVLLADVCPNENTLAVGGERSLVGEWDLDTLNTVPNRQESDGHTPLQRIEGQAATLYASYRERPGLRSTIKALRYINAPENSFLAKPENVQPLLAVADAGLDMRIWSKAGLANTGHIAYKPGDPGIIYALAFLNEQGTRLAYGGSKGSGVVSIDKSSLTVAPDETAVLPSRIRALAVDGKFRRMVIATGNLANTDWGGNQFSWTIELGLPGEAKPRPLPQEKHTDGQWAAAVDRKGQILLTAGWDERAVVWRRGKPGNDTQGWISSLLNNDPDTDRGLSSPVLSAAIHPEGRDIVTGTQAGVVYLWRDEALGFRSIPLPDNEKNAPIRTLAYSPDGSRLWAGDDNGTFYIWKINGRNYTTPEEPKAHHQGAVFTIQFSHNGKMVTGGIDGKVYLWENDEAVLKLEGPTVEVTSVAIADSGDLVAAGDTSGTIHLWELGLDRLIDRACSSMRRNLSWSEWQKYLEEKPYECTCPGLPRGRDVPPERLARDHRCQVSSEAPSTHEP